MKFKKALALSPLGDPTLRVLGMKGHMPEYYLLGVEKCGTTTLHDYIIQHPQINAGRRKECFYYDKHYRQGDRWYRGNFPRPHSIDSTPTYYRNMEILSRVPTGKKYVVILRDPIARIKSAYNMCRYNKWDDRPFDEAKDGHIEQSIYVTHLRNIFKRFGKVHVMFLEELKKDPVKEMNRLFDSWGLPPHTVNRIPPQLVGTYVADITTPQIRELKEIFAVHDKQLEILLDRKLPWRNGS